jgi:hypothetical protein
MFKKQYPFLFILIGSFLENKLAYHCSVPHWEVITPTIVSMLLKLTLLHIVSKSVTTRIIVPWVPSPLLRLNMPICELAFVPHLASPQDFHISSVGIPEVLSLARCGINKRGGEWGWRD